MDAPVRHQPLQGALRDLAADRIESGEDDRLRRVVDDHVDPGHGLEGADVPPLAPDDAPFHLVARQMDHGDGGFRGVVRRAALDGQRDDLARLALGVPVQVLADLLEPLGRFGLRLVLEVRDELLLRLVGGHAADALQPGVLLDQDPRELLVPFLELPSLHVQLALQPFLVALLLVQDLGAAVQVSFLLLELPLRLHHLALDRLGLAVQLRLLAEPLVLGFEEGALLLRLGLAFRLTDDLLGQLLGTEHLSLSDAPVRGPAEEERHEGGGERDQDGCQRG